VCAERQSRWVREDQLIACLANVSSLCASHLRSLARTCRALQGDPRHVTAFGSASSSLEALATLESTADVVFRGDHVLQLAVAQRVVRRLLGPAPALRWLARYHPDALAVFIAVSELSLSPRVSEESIGIVSRKPQLGPHRRKRTP
jgi:hypothetical protein